MVLSKIDKQLDAGNQFFGASIETDPQRTIIKVRYCKGNKDHWRPIYLHLDLYEAPVGRFYSFIVNQVFGINRIKRLRQ